MRYSLSFVLLNGLALWAPITLGGPCKMSSRTSESVSATSASGSTTALATVISTSAVPLSSKTSTAVSLSTFSTTKLEVITFTTSSLTEISTPPATTESTTSAIQISTTSSTEATTTSSAPSTPFISSQPYAVNAQGAELPINLPAWDPRNDQTWAFTGTGFNKPVRTRMNIDPITSRLRATWEDGEVRWANIYVPAGRTNSAQALTFSPTSFIQSTGRHWIVCETTNLSGNMLFCNLDDFSGPWVRFMKYATSDLPYTYVGTDMFSGSPIEIYLGPVPPAPHPSGN